MSARFLPIRAMLRKGFLAVGLILAALLAAPTLAQIAPTTWYVHNTCARCGEGTAASPFRTIRAALSATRDGDTIRVARGTYSENLSIDARITLMGGYDARGSNWTRDVDQYETIIASADRTVPGDWNGDWLGSFCILADSHAYRMWYSAGSEVSGAGIGYADSPDGIHWFQPYRSALLSPGPWGAWDGAEVADPAVLSTGTILQMWYVGANASGERSIGCATSPDGFTWQRCHDNPVLRPDSMDMGSFGDPSVLRTGSGTLMMWYAGGGALWLATSPDGLTWDKVPGGPILSPGAPGAWDDARIYAPTVIAHSGRYELWYVGESRGGTGSRIGHAWSHDGFHWTKSSSYPVLIGEAGYWEEAALSSPAVTLAGGSGYQMWYRGGSSGHRAIGRATSTTGLAWTKYDDNPMLLTGKRTHWGPPVVSFGIEGDGAVLDGFTIRNGYAKHGGGILAYETSPVIRASRIVGNQAHQGGGGLWLGSGSAVVEHCVISENRSAWRGGGLVSSYASPTIADSLIADNTARDYGGGLAFLGPSQPSLSDTVVADNKARWGGGIHVVDDVELDLDRVQIRGNAAEQAAGIQVRYATLTAVNTALVDNAALYSGPGGLLFWHASGNLMNVTLAGNSASSGLGGIAFTTDDPAHQLEVVNSILFFNGAQDMSCSGGTCAVTYSDLSQGWVGPGNISADPLFVNRRAGDYHLSAASPAIDAGTSIGAPAVDWEGDPRLAGRVDMGADEVMDR